MTSLNFVQYNLEKATRVPYEKEQSSFCPLTTHESLNQNIFHLTQASVLLDCCSEQAEMFYFCAGFVFFKRVSSPAI